MLLDEVFPINQEKCLYQVLKFSLVPEKSELINFNEVKKNSFRFFGESKKNFEMKEVHFAGNYDNYVEVMRLICTGRK